MWECRSQDFRNWKPFAGEKKPPVQVASFATREEAEEAKRLARSLGIEACVVAAHIRRKRAEKAEGFNLARADWQMHP